MNNPYAARGSNVAIQGGGGGRSPPTPPLDGGGLGAQPSWVEAQPTDSPFSEPAASSVVKLEFIADFSNASSKASAAVGVVIVPIEKIIAAATHKVQEGLKVLEFAHAMPISVRVVGTSLTPSMAAACHLEMFDGNKKPLHTPTLLANTVMMDVHESVVGYPMWQGPGIAMASKEQLADEFRSFWNFSMDQLSTGTTVYTDPNTMHTSVHISRNSTAAVLLDFALSKRNSFISPDFIDGGPNGQNFVQGHTNLLQLPQSLYNEVVKAFKEKLNNLKKVSTDLRKIHLELRLFDRLNSMTTGPVFGQVKIAIEAEIPLKAGGDGARPLLKQSAPIDNDKDDDTDW
jgi:hypothetical protein